MSKNFRSLFLRHFIAVFFMAFLVPLILSAFFSFAKNLFVPPATFGIGQPHPVKSLSQAFDAARGSGRHKVILVDNGHTGGDIQTVLDRLATEVQDAGVSSFTVARVSDESDLVLECPSTLRGVTECFDAVVMRSSPNEGPGGIWNYTIRTDAALANSPEEIVIDRSTNPEEVYLLPMQRAVDSIIASISNPKAANPLADTQEYPFTSLTPKQRDKLIQEIYQRAIISFLGVAYIALVIWITYHLTGFIATERESGMSQLIDAMMPVKQPWMSQAARIIANHLSFSIVYAPAWIIGSIIIHGGVFPHTSIGITLIFTLIGGLAMASMSILYASFFKKAQLSGITAILATLLLGILAQSITSPNTVAVAVLSALFTPCAYVYFINFQAHFERLHIPANLAQNPPHSSWELPGIVLWIFLIIHIFVYPLLGALIEKNFYGTTTKGRKIYFGQSEEPSLGEHPLQLQNFTKIYPPSTMSRIFASKSKPAESVVAVSNLNLNIGRGQIVALLGANGSGKSTTLDAIAGLSKLTNGSITIDGTGGLGITPQKNVLWDDLNVEEHLSVFSRLKSPGAPATKQKIFDLIEAIDLTPKRRSLAKTLSGGQKRKLQLGMMLVGNSALCCVDEVSSGIDPLSRRKIWDILLRERGRRTFILTTHFLDEADFLADHIAILSKGTLRAEGSSVELKDKFGGGYRIQVQKGPDAKRPEGLDGVRVIETFQHFTYLAPSSSLAASVVRHLESNGIRDYRFSGPTVEDVFLKLAAELQDEKAFRNTERGQELHAENEKQLGDEDEMSQDVNGQQRLKLLDGKRIGYVSQARILFVKRFTILKRNWVPYALAFLIPIIAAGLTSLFIKGQKQTGCSPADQSTASSTEDAFTQAGTGNSVILLAGPPSKLPANALALIQPIFTGSGGNGGAAMSTLNNLHLVDTFSDFQQFITQHRRNVTTALWLGDDSTPPTVSWVGNLFITSCLLAQQFEDVLLTNTTIATTWSSFDIPFSPSTGNSLNLVIYMGIALSCYPAFFSLYPSNERRRFVRALQYSNGVRPIPLWLAYTLFDLIFVVISTAIVTAIWAGVSEIFYHVAYIFLVFFLFGLASILLSYLVSLFTKTQLGTFAWIAAGQLVFFLGYLIAYLSIITYVTTAKIDQTILIAHFVISAILPIGSATRAMFLALNLFSTACDGQHLSPNPGGITGYGGPVLYLIVQTLIYAALVLWFDSGSAGASLRSLFERHRKDEPEGSQSDEELADELVRVNSSGTQDDGLQVKHLTKSFGKNTAVEDVTFGIKRGEVFALLGPNGAGKSTTISLIRGDIKPSRHGGDIFVENVSVTKNLPAARTNLGVCPQIDAIDQMTVREHLEFYAKIRGIPDVEHNVAAVLHAVGLEAFSTRMAHALSGGNKRKLSLGIALMGNPTVVLLDEPSSGLDAAAKRIMWKTLEATVPGRSILLTTHSMEEADALAGRVGILARRMLALGTPDGLRRRYGDVLHVHLVCATAPRTTDEEMQRANSLIAELFPSAQVEEKTYHGQMRFSVSSNDVTAAKAGDTGGGGEISRECEVSSSHSAIGRMVVLLEEHKAALGVEHFSVSLTTLDQVFLTIVGRHNVKEENYEEKKPGMWKRMVKSRRR